MSYNITHSIETVIKQIFDSEKTCEGKRIFACVSIWLEEPALRYIGLALF